VVDQSVLHGELFGSILGNTAADAPGFDNGTINSALLQKITAKKTGDSAAYDQSVGLHIAILSIESRNSRRGSP